MPKPNIFPQEIFPGIFVGPSPSLSSDSIQYIQAYRFTHIVNMARDCRYPLPPHVSLLHVKIDDLYNVVPPFPLIANYIANVFNFDPEDALRWCLRSDHPPAAQHPSPHPLPSLVELFAQHVARVGRRVLIHCLCGVSRSGSAAISAIMRIFNVSAFTAAFIARTHRRRIAPNAGFMHCLASYERASADLLTETHPGDALVQTTQPVADSCFLSPTPIEMRLKHGRVCAMLKEHTRRRAEYLRMAMASGSDTETVGDLASIHKTGVEGAEAPPPTASDSPYAPLLPPTNLTTHYIQLARTPAGHELLSKLPFCGNNPPPAGSNLEALSHLERIQQARTLDAPLPLVPYILESDCIKIPVPLVPLHIIHDMAQASEILYTNTPPPWSESICNVHEIVAFTTNKSGKPVNLIRRTAEVRDSTVILTERKYQ